jgi:hypothetical protein
MDCRDKRWRWLIEPADGRKKDNGISEILSERSATERMLLPHSGKTWMKFWKLKKYPRLKRASNRMLKKIWKHVKYEVEEIGKLFRAVNAVKSGKKDDLRSSDEMIEESDRLLTSIVMKIWFWRTRPWTNIACVDVVLC